MTSLRISSRAPTSLHPLDAYATPAEAVRALMAIECLPKSIADPCVGTGAIVDVLAASGYSVFGSDVVNYGWKHTVVRDYLTEPFMMLNNTGIVTNPPFRLAEAFIRKAIADGAKFHAWLLRLQFLESVSRIALFRDHPPSRIWVSSRRLPMMHRAGWAGPIASSNVAYAWFVWDARAANDDRQPPVIGWFDWAA